MMLEGIVMGEMLLLYFATASITVIFSLLAVYFRDLFASAIFLGVSSLFLALTFFLLRAPDIAIAEAAIGAALSTFLLIMAISRTGGEE